MDTLDTLDTLNFLTVNKERLTKCYKKRKNLFVIYKDEEFRKRYRFTKENARKLVSLVKTDLKGKANGGKIPPHIQVLAALRCWGRNQIQDDCGDAHGFSQSTMNRVCQNVARAFAKLAKTTIKMPTSTEEQIKTMENFEKIAGLKKILGAIDCTHLRIQAVGGDDAQLYVNRKGYFSFNVQVVCDSNLKINDIVACWRGSTHDSRIFNESTIKNKFENGNFIGRLIGDGGYKCTNYMFTPVNNPKDNKEESYNKVHIKTRNVVERLFGVWKSRFGILLEKMRLSRKNAKTLIVALAMLHNLSIMFHEEEFESNIQETASPTSSSEITQNDLEYESSQISRAIYIERHF